MSRELGYKGEEIAANYLKKKGYRILERNYYTRYGELDIICEKQRELVFVEVKTRRSIKYGFPEESITRRKMEHLRKAAFIYLQGVNTAYRGIRFDVIAIMLTNQTSINHIENAF